MPAGVTFASLVAGTHHTCALGSDNKAYCWGYGSSGQLGNGGTSQKTVPTAVSLPAGVTFTGLAAGSVHTCALGSNGKAYCWGNGGSGRLGNGAATNQSTPTAVSLPAGVTFSGLAAGNLHTCALGSDSKAYCWGNGGSGQLGNGAATNQSTPTAVSLPAGVTSFSGLAAGNVHTCALGSDSKAYCWGSGGSGQLGNGATTNQLTPVPVSEPQ